MRCRGVPCCAVLHARRWQILSTELDTDFTHKPRLSQQQAEEAQRRLPELANNVRSMVGQALGPAVF